MNKRAKKQKAIIFVIVLILALIFVYPLFLIVMNSVELAGCFSDRKLCKGIQRSECTACHEEYSRFDDRFCCRYYFTCGDDCILDIQISDEIFKSL